MYVCMHVGGIFSCMCSTLIFVFSKVHRYKEEVEVARCYTDMIDASSS